MKASVLVLYDLINPMKLLTLKLVVLVDGWGISCEISLRWMSLDVTYDMSTLALLWRDAVRQQAITSNSVDEDRWCHMASLFQNELTNKYKSRDYRTYS